MMRLVEAILPLLGPRLMGWIFPDKAKCHRKNQLRRLLSDMRFPAGRSLIELRRKTGTTKSECRQLLAEIGAEGITLRNGEEGWRMPETGKAA